MITQQELENRIRRLTPHYPSQQEQVDAYNYKLASEDYYKAEHSRLAKENLKQRDIENEFPGLSEQSDIIYHSPVFTPVYKKTAINKSRFYNQDYLGELLLRWACTSRYSPNEFRLERAIVKIAEKVF